MSVPFQIKVNAGNHDRNYCPVVFQMEISNALIKGAALDSLVMKDEQGGVTRVQAIETNGYCHIHFIVEQLAKGESRTYKIELEAEAEAEGQKTAASGVEFIHEESQKIDVLVGGSYFTSYVYDSSIAKPYLGPMIGPYGDSYTRLDFETKEHPHHRSLWLAIGDVNGIDMWNEPAERHGRQLHQKFAQVIDGPVCGVITSHNVWTSFNKKPQIDEARTITVYNTPAGGRIIDLDVRFTASYGQVEFGATKEAGPLGIRVAESMKVDNGGTMVNSYGSVSEAECWGKRAEWCDYYGEVGGHTLGIAAFDHPDNEQFPIYWHIRNYGLLAANNFYFNGGKLIKPKETVRYQYRVYFHDGDTQAGNVANKYQDYLHPPQVEIIS
ncbi:DUF6807 domain-containing protein [Paenibacillus agricola]|uniref:Methane oxygenase PmoA n=1 Tax=Paenibacillus agricola TaxID=2716264 RepID=A0ABX0J4W0_9BACL|nr:PmoA family protein [Paenibacillus agricola]NHN29862.1 hypothetical protein [Paenibacillus agricola]